ncbi:MAG TPA: SDR family oxidoreductase [Chthonomonadaceae bacterium]|nr:SDR family oxidoreductase [Chthonomonadaceae bacterium]
MDLRGKTALITGGGTGLGREIALQLAAEGMDLGIAYSRSADDAEQTAADARALGVRADTLRGDLAATADALRLVRELDALFGRLDLLIHNAGTTRFIPFPDLDAVDEAAWDEIFAVNTRAAFFLSQAAAPIMRRNGGGQIITTSSVAGIAARGSSLPYAVSKSALIHLTKCLAVALAPDIRVNSVAPGLLETRWAAVHPPERLEAMKQGALLNRHPGVGDTAAAFVMLAKNESITGQTIVVDAGALGA